MSTEGQTPLSELLNEPSEAPEAVEAAPEPVVDEGQPRDEHGRFAKKGEEEDASPAPVEETAFEGAATIGERKRRQQAEQERDDFRARFEALEKQLQSLQQPRQEPTPPPSIWEDEAAYGQHLTGQAVSEASFNAQLNTSEMLCRDRFEDFDEKKAKFLEMAKDNPVIVQQALADPHPWRRAYQIATNAARIEELGATDLADLEAKLREKITAELQAQSPVPQQVTIPPTLTTERSVGNRSGPQWAGPKSLEELLG